MLTISFLSFEFEPYHMPITIVSSSKIRSFDRQNIGGSTFAGENDNEDFGYLADL
ncbi:hypothetical protein Hanom_Chr09g00830921 [Helianthus anomalus]